VALLLGGWAPAPEKADKEAAIKKEWKRLNGTWKLVRVVYDGQELHTPKAGETATIQDGKVAVRFRGKRGMLTASATLKLDPTTSPKSLDATTPSGPGKGRTDLAIYEVKGDTYRVCYGEPRPKTFEAKRGSGHALYIYKRVKPRD
jgi:uncharacterized protein (TIGR03067 family)